MENLLAPFDLITFLCLILGILVHSAIKLRDFVLTERRAEFSLKIWWQKNGLLTAITVLCAVVLYFIAGHDDKVAKALGHDTLGPLVAAMIGYNADSLIKILGKKLPEKD